MSLKLQKEKRSFCEESETGKKRVSPRRNCEREEESVRSGDNGLHVVIDESVTPLGSRGLGEEAAASPIKRVLGLYLDGFPATRFSHFSKHNAAWLEDREKKRTALCYIALCSGHERGFVSGESPIPSS
ncbi:hypothetical protein VNO77_33005 [Canavalia gladiata]|uniref:Uncharacterized protein n=1 Tax=Canavalia gladiata TaxID=3824 RepID=A0AAN9PW06_CANGL